jgi:hypothetical protein
MAVRKYSKIKIVHTLKIKIGYILFEQAPKSEFFKLVYLSTKNSLNWMLT